MEFAKISRFYDVASPEEMDAFERGLDEETEESRAAALRVVDSVLLSSETQRVAAKDPTYLEQPPEVGDMVFLIPTSRYVRLLAVSDDRELALVKEQMGCYPIPFRDIRRVR